MLLAVVLLYVGAVLTVNGIWLIGQARAAGLRARAAGQETAGGATDEAAVTGHPTFIENREAAILKASASRHAVLAHGGQRCWEAQLLSCSPATQSHEGGAPPSALSAGPLKGEF